MSNSQGKFIHLNRPAAEVFQTTFLTILTKQRGGSQGIVPRPMCPNQTSKTFKSITLFLSVPAEFSMD